MSLEDVPSVEVIEIEFYDSRFIVQNKSNNTYRIFSFFYSRHYLKTKYKIDGIKFFSDRPYLHAPTGIADYDREKRSSPASPPLLDRSRLLANLELE